MKKIVIFGATGNVGSWVTKYASEYFDKNEYEVIATGRRKTDVFTKMGIPYYSVDISNSKDFDALPKEDVYAVIDLAATIPSYMDEYDASKYVNSNIIGAFNVLEYCRKVKADRILFSTTVFDISLYAEPGVVLEPHLPLNFSYKGDHAVYVITKNTSIEFMKHYYEEYGLKYFIFRFPTIYGYSPYQYYFPNGIKTMRPLYQMINNAIEGKDIELWGDPNYSKDMVHVYDCAQMLCKAVEVEGIEHEIYNVGTGIPVTMQEQIEAIIDVFSPKDNPSKIVYKPDKPVGGGFLMNVDNAKKDLGYEPVYTPKKLFKNYKEEMKINRFADLRNNNK